MVKKMGEEIMNIQEIIGRSKQIRGEVREGIGKLNGNKEEQRKGRAEQLKGRVEEKIGKLRRELEYTGKISGR
jgi:uncharacterized protein YjbJ (UPF0337 family)